RDARALEGLRDAVERDVGRAHHHLVGGGLLTQGVGDGRGQGRGLLRGLVHLPVSGEDLAARHAHFSVRAVTPGRALPSRNSSEAPPPVETCETCFSRPACSIAAAESPPPMIVIAPLAVASTRAWATAKVPFEAASISKTPTGPFHTTVFAPV